MSRRTDFVYDGFAHGFENALAHLVDPCSRDEITHASLVLLHYLEQITIGQSVKAALRLWKTQQSPERAKNWISGTGAVNDLAGALHAAQGQAK